MAHYARISDGIVIDIHVLANAVIEDDDGTQHEELGQAFLANLWGGEPSEYVRTFYPVNQPTPYPRGCYAGIGYAYDAKADVFRPPVTEAPNG